MTVPKRKIPNGSSQANARSKIKFPSACSRAKDVKRRFINDIPKQKLLKSPGARPQATLPEQIVQGGRSQFKHANAYFKIELGPYFNCFIVVYCRLFGTTNQKVSFVVPCRPLPLCVPASLRDLSGMGQSRAPVEQGPVVYRLTWVKFELLFAFQPDGRKCKLCNHVDSGEDPASKATLLSP